MAIGSEFILGFHYQQADEHLLDYELVPVQQFGGFPIRGPAVDLSQPYAVCLGAAQTFGRFCERPYPMILAEHLDVQVMNLGIGGVGPSFFNQDPFLDIIGRATFAVVQVFSGRSVGNSRFDNSRTRAMLGVRTDDGREMRSEEFYAHVRSNESPEVLAGLLAEARANYVSEFKTFLSNLSVPTVLFWFSRRRPGDLQLNRDLDEAMGAFPQLVDESMMREIAPEATRYVECVSSAGLPQTVGRSPIALDGAEWESGLVINRYYPSPEMHVQAADILAPVCANLVGACGGHE